MCCDSRRPLALSVALLALSVALLASTGCRGCGAPSEPGEPDAGDAAVLPDAAADAGEPSDAGDEGHAEAPVPLCPHDMVRVARRFCVDRYEAELVDVLTGQAISPYYPPSRKLAASMQKLWDEKRLEDGDEEAHAMALPLLPGFERAHEIEPKAVSRKGVVPQGYTSGELAARACKNAGKRLCALGEWRTACRGEADRDFPYGNEYVQGKCNVFREAHPASVLHGNPSVGHTDPRLNLVTSKGKPLLRRTGDTPSCTSAWEDDGVADMVGNIDEWIDDPEGTFVGAFYARSKKDGCASIVTNHSIDYWDYSTGVRCCLDLKP